MRLTRFAAVIAERVLWGFPRFAEGIRKEAGSFAVEPFERFVWSLAAVFTAMLPEHAAERLWRGHQSLRPKLYGRTDTTGKKEVPDMEMPRWKSQWLCHCDYALSRSLASSLVV